MAERRPALATMLEGAQARGEGQMIAAVLATIDARLKQMRKILPFRTNPATGEKWSQIEINEATAAKREELMRGAGLWPDM